MKPLTEKDKTFSSSPGQFARTICGWPIAATATRARCGPRFAKAQQDLSEKAGKDVKNKDSDSSLALSLQNQGSARRGRQVCVEAGADRQGQERRARLCLSPSTARSMPAISIARRPCFRRPGRDWIQANAIEAFADMKKDKAFPAVAVADIKSFLDDASKGKASGKKDAPAGIHQSTTESAKSYNIQSFIRDSKAPDAAKKGNAAVAGAGAALELHCQVAIFSAS